MIMRGNHTLAISSRLATVESEAAARHEMLAKDAANSGARVGDRLFLTKAIGTGVQIVDARPMPFYVGLARKPIVGSAGHIKGAVNLPPDVRTSAQGGTHYLTPAEYTSIFRHLDINASKPSITYCNTGHLASGAWFVLSEVMKNPNTRLYDGSMYEWTAEKRPVVGLH